MLHHCHRFRNPLVARSAARSDYCGPRTGQDPRMENTMFRPALAMILLLGFTATIAVVADEKGLTVWSFEKDEVGKPPAGFEFAVTAKKQPGKWVVEKDGDNKVLAQEDRDKTP